MFLRVGAAAKGAGVDFDMSLAALTAVNATGMQPEVVSRWFGAFTGGLRTIEHRPKRVAQGLKLLGLDAEKVATGMKRDALGTMLDLFNRLEKSPEAPTAAVKIFGQEWWDETSRAKAAIPEIRKQLDLLRSPGNYKGLCKRPFKWN
jgi:TP901 family phage tail tape measure protein